MVISSIGIAPHPGSANRQDISNPNHLPRTSYSASGSLANLNWLHPGNRLSSVGSAMLRPRSPTSGPCYFSLHKFPNASLTSFEAAQLWQTFLLERRRRCRREGSCYSSTLTRPDSFLSKTVRAVIQLASASGVSYSPSLSSSGPTIRGRWKPSASASLLLPQEQMRERDRPRGYPILVFACFGKS